MGWLFDSSVFVTRDHCGAFTPPLIASWVCASLVLFIAYALVALRLIYARRHTRLLAQDHGFPHWGMIFIALFFVGCGGGHLLNAVAFVWPAYRFYVLWDWYTAIVSCIGFIGVDQMVRWAEIRITTLTMERDAAREQLRIERDEAREQARQARRERDVALAELDAVRGHLTVAQYDLLYRRIEGIAPRGE